MSTLASIQTNSARDFFDKHDLEPLEARDGNGDWCPVTVCGWSHRTVHVIDENQREWLAYMAWDLRVARQ